MEQTAAVGGDMLVVAGAEAEKGAELVIPSTEPLGGPECLEAPHTVLSALAPAGSRIGGRLGHG